MPNIVNLDESHVLEVARAAVTDAIRDNRNTDRRIAAIDRRLIYEFGESIAGWTWTRANGGPIEEMNRLDRGRSVTAAVMAWRQCVLTLSSRFAELGAETRGGKEAEIVCAGISGMLPLVLEWTDAEDAWYAFFECALRWFLESVLGDPARALELASAAIDGQFHSWIAPRDEHVAAAEAKVRTLCGKQARSQVPDVLDGWLQYRSGARWVRNYKRFYKPAPVERDGHDRYIDAVDSIRDPARAARMKTALALAREAATSGAPFDFDLAIELQQHIVDVPGAFRDTDAFAHDGSERYAAREDLYERFKESLAEMNNETSAVHIRAARAYLDVCFFHPFADGNARLARLALDYLLTRNGLALHAAGPVFRIERRAQYLNRLWSLPLAIDYLAGPIAKTPNR